MLVRCGAKTLDLPNDSRAKQAYGKEYNVAISKYDRHEYLQGTATPLNARETPPSMFL